MPEQADHLRRDEFTEDIPEHVEHVGDTHFHKAQEVARNTMKIVCIADLNSATGVACYVHADTSCSTGCHAQIKCAMRNPGVHLPSLSCANRINCKVG